jgi:hypothetical protein
MVVLGAGCFLAIAMAVFVVWRIICWRRNGMDRWREIRRVTPNSHSRTSSPGRSSRLRQTMAKVSPVTSSVSWLDPHRLRTNFQISAKWASNRATYLVCVSDGSKVMGSMLMLYPCPVTAEPFLAVHDMPDRGCQNCPGRGALRS